MTAFAGAPTMDMDSDAEVKPCSGVGFVLYVARRPELINSQSAIRKAPTSMVGRRPQRSMKRMAGMAMTTLMMN